MQPQLLAAIAFGGALGAVARHLTVAQVALWTGHGFPFGTLAVNVAGSFAMGLIVELSALVWSPAPELRAFLTVGFLGAFPPFPHFSLQTVLLYQPGRLLPAAPFVQIGKASF